MTETDAPAIRISNLDVERGGNRVLPGISLDVRRGAVTGLLGPSGSGKTTLLRAIVGVQIVKSGEIKCSGCPPARLRCDRVGYMTQAPSVYADLTVRENLAYFARVLGAAPRPRGRDHRARRARRHVGQLVGPLSGGQRARVSLASALVGDPDVLVLDEPTVGLDPVLRRDLWDSSTHSPTSGTTLLVSSHVMDEAARCDRLVLLRDGASSRTSPEALLRSTGRRDLDSAFLRLVEEDAR